MNGLLWVIKAQTLLPKPGEYNAPILKRPVSPGYFCRAVKAKPGAGKGNLTF